MTVTMRSGQEPSVMLIFAPLWKESKYEGCFEHFKRVCPANYHTAYTAYLLSESLHNVALLAYYAANLL